MLSKRKLKRYIITAGLSDAQNVCIIRMNAPSVQLAIVYYTTQENSKNVGIINVEKWV